MRIQNNIAALNTSKNLAAAQKKSQNNIAKLSSGYAINKAGDNASGLAVSEKMRSQIRGLKQASKNATDGINLVSTAEGYMNTANDILQRMRELAVQSANGTYDPGNQFQTVEGAAATGNASTAAKATGDRAKINEEIQQLTDELDRIAKTATFNGRELSGGTFVFQVGSNTKTAYKVNAKETFDHDAVDTLSNSVASVDGNNRTGFEVILNSKQGSSSLNGADAAAGKNAAGTATDRVANSQNYSNAEMIQLSIAKFDSASLGVAPKALASGEKGAAGSGIDLTTQAGANASIDKIDNAISTITANRARLGAVQNRLEYTVDNIATSIENTTASESAIRDTDMVAEMMDFTKNNVLSQAATAMMAQANTQTQSVLQLLQ